MIFNVLLNFHKGIKLKSFINNVLLVSSVLIITSQAMSKDYYNGRNWLGVNDLQTISLTVADTVYGNEKSPSQTYRLWGLSCYSPACTRIIIHEGALNQPVAIADKLELLQYLDYAKSKSVWTVYKFGHYQKIIDWIKFIHIKEQLVERQDLREYERGYYERSVRKTVISSTRPFEHRPLAEIGQELREQFRNENFEIEIKGATKLSTLICRSIF